MLFEVLASGAFDHLNCQHTRESGNLTKIFKKVKCPGILEREEEVEMEKPLFVSTKTENQMVPKGKTNNSEGHFKMQVSKANQKTKNKTGPLSAKFGLDLQ